MPNKQTQNSISPSKQLTINSSTSVENNLKTPKKSPTEKSSDSGVSSAEKSTNVQLDTSNFQSWL